ncbi:MAG TPA: GH25 family lysozyme [Blastocatellia bacterium]|jgi:lysozyme|nr:GH25 family lysozyme [Blastocatellia bacterium]
MSATQPDATGIDVSHFQGAVNWDEVASAGSSFAFTKATEGLYTVDAMFAANWPAMKDAGLLRGAYHFFHASEDATAQANHFMATVQLQPGDLPPVLDVESGGLDGVSSSSLVEGMTTWLELVEQRTGFTPMLYVSPSFANEYLESKFGAYPLWVAEYGVAQPRTANGWETWTFWQHSQSGTISGVNGTVDLDTFTGPAVRLQAFANPMPANVS